jgi:hypothetical protein
MKVESGASFGGSSMQLGRPECYLPAYSFLAHSALHRVPRLARQVDPSLPSSLHPLHFSHRTSLPFRQPLLQIPLQTNAPDSSRLQHPAQISVCALTKPTPRRHPPIMPGRDRHADLQIHQRLSPRWHHLVFRAVEVHSSRKLGAEGGLGSSLGKELDLELDGEVLPRDISMGQTSPYVAVDGRLRTWRALMVVVIG